MLEEAGITPDKLLSCWCFTGLQAGLKDVQELYTEAVLGVRKSGSGREEKGGGGKSNDSAWHDDQLAAYWFAI